MNTSKNTPKIFWLLWFLLFARLRELFQWQYTLGIIGRGAFFIVTMLYAVGIAFALDNAEFADKIQPDVFIRWMNIAIVASTFLKSYYPTFRPVNATVEAFHPLRAGERAFISAVLDIASAYTATMTAFYGVIFALSHTFGAAYFLVSLLALWSAVLLDRSLRLVLTYNVPNRSAVIVSIGVTAVALMIFLFPKNIFGIVVGSGHPALWLCLMTAVCLVAAEEHYRLARIAALPTTDYVANSSSTSTNAASSATPFTLNGLLWRAFLRAKHVRLMLGMAFGLKVIIVGILLYKGRVDVFTRPHSFMLFLLPVMLFTYILNNLWGTNWQLWQTYHASRGDRRSAFLLYMQLAMPLLALDALVFGVAIWYGGFANANMVLLYVCTTAVLVAIGFATSTLRPLKREQVPSFGSFQQYSSAVGVIVAMAAICIVYVGIVVGFGAGFTWALWLTFLFVILIWVAAVGITADYHIHKHKAYSAIHG